MAPINLPDGSQVSEIVLPDGSTASEVLAPDGSTVFGNAIPDILVALYEYENDADTTAAVDSVGSNNATISGASYDSDSAVGAFALNHSDGDKTESSNAVNYVTNGTEEAVALNCWLKPASEVTDVFYCPVAWRAGNDNYLVIVETGGTWGATVKNGAGNSTTADSNVSLDASSHQHIVAYATQSEVGIYVNDVLEATASHSIDISTIGEGVIQTGDTATGFPNYIGLVDDVGVIDKEPTSGDVNELYSRGN